MTFSYIAKTIIHDEYNSDPTHAIIKFTPALLKRIRKLYWTVKKVKAYRIQEFDYTPEFKILKEEYDEYDYDLSILDKKNKKYFSDWTEGSIDALLLSVTDSHIYWEGLIKHSDIPVETTGIDLEELWEMEKVMRTKPLNLPLLMGTLKKEKAKELFEKRLKTKLTTERKIL